LGPGHPRGGISVSGVPGMGMGTTSCEELDMDLEEEEEEMACQGDCMSRLLLLSLSSVKWDRVLNANKISNIQIFQFQPKKITGPKRFTSGLGLGLVMGLDNTFTAQSDLLMGVVDVRLLSSYWHLLRLHFHMPKRVLGKGYRKV